MPRCGSQIILCDVPIRFDTYQGCSHGCKYCFASYKRNLENIKNDESSKSLLNFIKGERTIETKWCDWDIPLHWGGLSDPLQPIEKINRVSYKCLEVLNEFQYPYIISTKGKLLGDDEYISMFEKSNVVIQVSLVDKKFDAIEKGAPSFEERIKIIEKISKINKRIIIRIQPYITDVKKDVLKNLDLYSKIGVYGIILEGMKFKSKKQGLIKISGDIVYPKKQLLNDFIEIKEKAHNLGMKFYSGENRLRNMGDSLCCCGIENMEGFNPNMANLNHYLFDKENFKYTENMKKKETTGVFKSLMQRTLKIDQSYETAMNCYIKDKKMYDIFFGE